ncbi:MAG: MBL fold metallo-hydrolase [Methanosarcinales archaeon]|nr:MBL fold metallo-hydrolase [Methanosarcinales archaeon]
MKLEFHGAAGGVTGSHMVLDLEGFRVGIDAGLFQGREADRNRMELGHDPGDLQAVLLTHAHTDHSGRLPLLVKKGFRGPVYATPATADLCDIMLRDSARLMEEEAERESNRDGPGEPQTQPLYTEEDVVRLVRRFRPVAYDNKMELGNLSVVFRDAGHILGSSLLEISYGKRKLVLSGDLGQPGSPILRDPYRVSEADWLVLESTYGEKDHKDRATRGDRLLEIVQETAERGGNVVIPAFAIGRTQEILYQLNPFAEEGRLKGIQCFVDSPMAISASEIYRRHPECYDAETKELLSRGDQPLEFPGIRYTRSRQESKAINSLREPHIIISASGMATGGRVLHHLAHNLERPESTIIFVGYQAEGTLGRTLQKGADRVRVMGKELEVQARIESLDAFSAHAGRSEIMQWLRAFEQPPSRIFLNHGEAQATGALAERIRDEFDAQVVIPGMGESYVLP